MMKYNLAKYDKIIHNILTIPGYAEDQTIMQPSLNDLLRTESIRIKRKIRETISRLNSHSKIELYIHKQQMALENLIDLVIREINPICRKDLYKISKVDSQSDKLKVVYFRLEKLQIFLENEFENYLNLDRTIPYRSFLKRRKYNTQKIEEIHKLKSTAQLSTELLEIVCKQLNIKYKKGITYSKFNFNTEFISELFIYLNSQSDTITDNSIIHFLIEMNYNTKPFFKFQIRKLSEELDNLVSVKEKIDYLYRILKIYNQMDTFGRLAYNKKRIHICKQIVNWVDQEIKYLSKNKALNKSASFPVVDRNKMIHKIKVDMSVAQLGCFFSFICKLGILKPKSNEYLFSFLSENFETPHVENISPKSISSRFYNIDTKDKDTVRAIFIQLLNISK